MLKYTIANKTNIVELNNLNQIGETSWQTEFFYVMQPSYVAVCLDSSKFVGIEGYIGYYLIHENSLVLTHRSERTIVNPNYRGQGIFEKLISTCDRSALNDNSAFSWGATSALKPFKKAGFNGYIGFRSYIFFPINSNILKKLFAPSKLHFFNPFKTYQSLKSKKLSEIKSFISWLSLIKPLKIKKSKTISFAEYKYELIKELIFKKDQSTYKLNPTNVFFDWLENKGLSYLKLLIRENQSIIGYVIVKPDANDNYCSIVDIYLRSDTVNISQVLFNLSKEEQFQKFDAFFLALNNSNNIHQSWIQHLQQSRVINLKKAGSFVIKPLNNKVSIEDLLLTDLWLEL